VWIFYNSARKFMKIMKFWSALISEFEIMFRILICFTVSTALISTGTVPALAQSAPLKQKFPATIAVASTVITQKNENCRLQAKQQGLHFLKRRRFMRECRAAP
jgi:energy-coupling factor transporter transmembrane protein EcfT